MKSFFERRDRWGHGLPLWLITGIAFLIPVLGWSLQYIQLDNDVTGWLPDKDPQAKVLHWYQDLFPSQDRVLVSWDDCSVTDPRLRSIAQRLNGIEKNGTREGGSPLIDDVSIPEDVLKRMMSEGIPFELALERIQGLIVGQGPLCLKLTEAARERTNTVRIGREITQFAKSQFGLEVELVERTLPLPTDEHLILEDEPGWQVYEAARAYVSDQVPADVQLRWPRMHIDHEITERFVQALGNMRVPDSADESCFEQTWFVRGSMAAMSVSLSARWARPTSRRPSQLDSCRSRRPRGFPRAQLHHGGPSRGRDGTESRREAGRHGTRRRRRGTSIHRSALFCCLLRSACF
jgi:hypothetical protein